MSTVQVAVKNGRPVQARQQLRRRGEVQCRPYFERLDVEVRLIEAVKKHRAQSARILEFRAQRCGKLVKDCENFTATGIFTGLAGRLRDEFRLLQFKLGPSLVKMRSVARAKVFSSMALAPACSISLAKRTHLRRW